MDEKFVARRGAKGDDWHWYGKPPPAPDDRRPQPARSPGRPPLAGLLAGIAAGFRYGGRKLRGEPGRSTTPQAAADPAATAQHGPAARRPKQPVRWSRLAPRFGLPALPTPRLRRTAPAAARSPRRGVPEEMRAPLTLFVALALAAVLSAGIVALVSVLDEAGEDGGSTGEQTTTPLRTERTPGVSPTPAGGGGPPTEAPTEGQAGTPSPSPTEAGTETPTPEAAVTLMAWSASLNGWEASTVPAADWQGGEALPFLVRWRSQPGAQYVVNLAYSCAGIDYLDAPDAWPGGALLADGGPGRERPDAAVPIPDTPDFAPDDGAAGVVFLYGGSFTVLPAPVQPGGGCAGERSLTLSVATSGAEAWLAASAHLAADARTPITLSATVSGVGSASVTAAP